MNKWMGPCQDMPRFNRIVNGCDLFAPAHCDGAVGFGSLGPKFGLLVIYSY